MSKKPKTEDELYKPIKNETKVEEKAKKNDTEPEDMYRSPNATLKELPKEKSKPKSPNQDDEVEYDYEFEEEEESDEKLKVC